MRPLILYTGIFAEPENNAAGKRVYGNAIVLEMIGFDVLMLGKSQNKELFGSKKYSEHIWFDSYPEYGRVRYKEYVAYFQKVIEQLPNKPVCIIRYGSPGISIFDAYVLKISHKMGIKVIADVVDWLYADGGSLIFNFIKTIDTYFEKVIFNSKSDGIIAISSYLSDYYKKRVDDVVIIPPIVSEYKLNIANNEKTKIVYAGSPFRLGLKVKNVHRIKDRLDLVIKSLNTIYRRGYHDFLFSIYGITKEQYLLAFPEHETMLLEIGDAVKFFGKINMIEVQNELGKADFSILLREVSRGTMAGFPTKVVESLSCGTPVITTKTSDLEEYIVDGKNGFFLDIADEDTMIAQLLSIIRMKKKDIRDMKEYCSKAKQFLPEAYKDKISTFFQNIYDDEMEPNTNKL